MKKLLSILVIAFSLSACDEKSEPPAVAIDVSKNGYQIVTLFEHKGCEMIRFIDKSEYRYFAKCDKTKQITSERDENCGKNCTRHVIETTIQAE